jgi:mono/diheme cytochrome c family protein
VRRRPLGVLLAAGLLLAGCGQDEKSAPKTAGPTGSSAVQAVTGPSAAPAAAPAAGDPEKGRQVWLGQCVACHNTDPSKDGPVGPAVKGSTLELLEARVLHGTYPPGYKPKRESRVMPARPDLVASVADLAAYLH